MAAERRSRRSTIEDEPAEGEYFQEMDYPTRDSPDIQVVSAATVAFGNDTATVTVTQSTPFPGGSIQWGTATGVYTSGLQQHKKTVLTTSLNATNQQVLSYTLQFKLTGMQQAAAQAYFGQIRYDDGTLSSEFTWTQPGLNASANDQVFFYDKVLTDFAAIMNWAEKASQAGWMLPDQWTNFRNLVINTAWYNYVKWNDGR